MVSRIAAADRVTRAVLVGAGEFGASFLYRSGRASGLRVLAAVDANVERVIDVARRAGFAHDRIVRCESGAEVRAAWTRGDFVAVADVSLLIDRPFEVIVEATGSPESAARVATLAIGHGKHVALVTKECDSVVGSALQARAAGAGLVCTPVDGDQPSLAIKLVRWARMLGLDIVCAGKAGEYDFVWDESAGTIAAIGTAVHAPWMTALWNGSGSELIARVAARTEQLHAWPHRTVPDMCELGIVANATGLGPDRPSLHAPVCRTLELADLMRPREEGGLFERGGVVDMFNCLRRSDELSFAGGVFVVVRCDDSATWRVLRGKGIPTSADGRHALLHNAVHLLGIEAPMTLFDIVATSQPVAQLAPVCDLHARALRKLPAGMRLDLGARHAIDGVEPLLAPAAPARTGSPIPYYMAAGCTLVADVSAGEMLRHDHVAAPEDSMIWRLRDEQDAQHFGTTRG